MIRSHRHNPLRVALRTGVVVLTLAGTIALGGAAWAGEESPEQAGQDEATQSAQQATTQQVSTKTPKVTADPRSGRPGTKVWVEADGRACDTTKPFEGRFLDREEWSGGRVGQPLTVEHASAAGWYGASYTISDKDAVGTGRFVVQCTTADGEHLVGSASFRVRAASSDSGDRTDDRTGQTDDSGSVQVPSRIDTGLGGTAEGADRGPAIAWLALPVSALLIGLATWRLGASGSRR